MKKYILIAIVLFLSSCFGKKEIESIKLSGKSIGTFYHITYYDKYQRNFQDEVQEVLNQMMNSCNVFDANSTLSKLNANSSNQMDTIIRDILQKALYVSEKSNGYFDVTAGTLINLWGFGSAGKNNNEINQQMIDSVLLIVGYNKVHIGENLTLVKENPDITLNFGAIAKGYAVDQVARFFDSKGIDSYLIEIGGEISAKGKKPNGKAWTVGISAPDERNPLGQEIQTRIELTNKSLATSGNYRNFYLVKEEKRVHTINPLTGHPADNELLSVTIIANDCTTADAFATAVMVAGLEEGLDIIANEPDIEAYFIYLTDDNTIRTHATKGFEALLQKE